MTTERLAGRSPVWVAAAITTLDGFDAFSMSLVAPRVIEEMGISTAALGPVFASTLGGMIVGAFAGGVLADKWGRVRVLLSMLALFGIAALTMTFVSNTGEILVNRLIAGIGLGAAAPIAVALLNQSSAKPPSDLVVSFVWAGLAVGGILAAGFNYLVVPAFGWRSIFIAGAVLPIPAAIVAYAVFRERPTPNAVKAPAPPKISDLFTGGNARRTLPTALMFFFGYVTTSIIVNWLPTVLSHRGASPAMISATFAGINVGSAVGSLGLGFLSSRLQQPATLSLAWAAAGLCAAAAALPGTSLVSVSLSATAAATLAAGSQALSVAFANRLHRGRNLESASVGLMISAGRIGQFGALSVSGTLIVLGLPETSLFAFAGASACIAAVIALLITRSARLPLPKAGV